jgi:hypothetical protein
MDNRGSDGVLKLHVKKHTRSIISEIDPHVKSSGVKGGF